MVPFLSKPEIAAAADAGAEATHLRYGEALLELTPLRFASLEESLHAILTKASLTLNVERASYWSLHAAGSAIVCQALFVRTAGAFTRGIRLEENSYPAYFAALRSCRAIDADDAANDPRTREFQKGYFDVFGITSMLDVPVWREGRLAGVVCFEHTGPLRKWCSEDVIFVRGIAQHLSTALEIDARNRAEQRYRLVQKAVGEVIYDADIVTGHVDWSDGLQDQFLHPPGENTTLDWWLSHVHADDRERVNAGILRALDGTATSWSDEYRFSRGDGTTAFVLDRGFITRDAQGNAVRITGAMQDVTHRRELEKRLAVSDRMASVGTLAAGVAHEINNPLTFVMVNLEVALSTLQEQGCDVELLQTLRDAHHGATRVAEIVRTMRFFSRIEPGRVGAVDLDRIVTDALALAMNEIRHRAQLVTKLSAPPRAVGSETQLVQVLVNLLVNAAQSISEGNADRDRIVVETGVEDGERAYVEVSDTGSGMTPEVLAKMYDPFFTTKTGQGLGLGLSIVQSIVASYGGDIRVTSAPGRGTTFRVLLPIANRDSGVVGTSLAPQTPRARVLVIDDEGAITRIFRRVLGNAHEVVTVSGGREALALLARDTRFDVIFCDVMMPDLTGADLHREVTVMLPEVARRFVFMTGGAFGEGTRGYVDASGLPMLTKPFKRETILRMIADATRPTAR